MRQAACTYRSGDPELGVAIAYLRDVLGEQTYEFLAQRGEAAATTAPCAAVRRLEIQPGEHDPAGIILLPYGAQPG